MSVLHAQNLSKHYGEGPSRLDILKGVNLDLDAGKVAAIQGPSGCGKSTLISIIAGLDSFQEGEVSVLGNSPVDMPPSEWNSFRAKNIGIIFQQFHLLEHLTAFENVRLPLDLSSNPDADKIAWAALDRVRLGERARHFPHELSRGESQRVAIARVLVMKPKLILADEPTASLDVKTGADVSRMIFELARAEKIAALVVTHDPSIADLCDEIYLMNDGKLQRK